MVDTGLIVKGIGGFYYVETANGLYECKARGVFRKKKITPLVGDKVSISINDNAENTIDEIFERKNSLIRPPLANIDTLFIVSSIIDPQINTVVLDRLIAIAEYKEIEPVIVFTKIDLDESYKKYVDIYNKAGFKTIVCDNRTGSGSDEVKSLLKDKISTEVQISVNNASLEALKAKQAEAQENIATLSADSVEYMRLERNAKITGQVYTSLVQNYEQTRIQEAKDSMDIQIIDAADLPKEDMPAKPNKKLVVAIGFVLGIMISFGYTLYNYSRRYGL